MISTLKMKFGDMNVRRLEKGESLLLLNGDLSDHDSHKYVSIMNRRIKQIALEYLHALS